MARECHNQCTTFGLILEKSAGGENCKGTQGLVARFAVGIELPVNGWFLCLLVPNGDSCLFQHSTLSYAPGSFLHVEMDFYQIPRLNLLCSPRKL